MDIKAIILLIIVGTVSAAVLITFASWLWYGPGSIPQESREKMYSLIGLLVGMLAGYILGRTNGGKTPPPR